MASNSPPPGKRSLSSLRMVWSHALHYPGHLIAAAIALLVAAAAAYVQFVLYRNNGLLWSLAICSMLTPLSDYRSPGKQYQWQIPNTGGQGDVHEESSLAFRPLVRPVG